MNTKTLHIISNDVSRSFVADGVLAYGGSPIMSEYAKEFSSLHQHASGLVISLGMLSSEKIKNIQRACESASASGLPIGIDPVGIHLSPERMALFKSLLKNDSVAFVRGNQDEVGAYLGDSFPKSKLSLEATLNRPLDFFLEKLSKDHRTWLITGETDYVISGKKYHQVVGGQRALRKVSGIGCLLSAMVGVALSYEGCTFTASLRASRDLKEASEQGEIGKLGALKTTLLSELEKRGYHVS